MTDHIPEEELAGGLNAAFGEHGSGASVLRALGAQPLHLPGTEPLPTGDATGRYQVVGEIARGGVGVVYKGRDVDLGRDVAMKVLRGSFRDEAEIVERFVEEAQIGGQLQHPGIVPVYELGLDSEGQPFFSMKLVKGKTLASVLKDGGASRRRLLTIFEQVCQTMAYAHARGVVHRDLKPANIMVGAFGEVQVVDWGFAKVLGRGGVADERPRKDVSVIATVRSGSEGSDSLAGSVMGTPAYMPPEQALGQVDALDERSDVFGLGAILFELLTGSPIYAKKAGDDPIVLAARCDLDAAFAKLEGEELEPLLRACLSPKQSGRPKNATHVAKAIAAHLADVDQRAQESELEAAQAVVHANGQRRKRKLTLVFGALVLAATVIGGATFLHFDAADREHATTVDREARAAHAEAVMLLGRGEFDGALEAIQVSQQLSDTEPARQLRSRIEHEAATSRSQDAQAALDRTLLAELVSIQSDVDETRDAEQLDRRLTQAFEDYGAAATDRESLRQRTPEVTVPIASALTYWSTLRRNDLSADRSEWLPLLQTASAIDPDPLRGQIRDAFRAGAHDELEAIAEDLDVIATPSTSIDLIAMQLVAAGRTPQATALLERGHRAHPGDYFVNLHLSRLHDDAAVAARHATAADALRYRDR